MTDFTVEVAAAPSYAVAPGDDGEYVVTMAEGATYEVAVSGGATTLAGLTDVDTSGVADGDALVYDDATDTWVPGAVSGTDNTRVLKAGDTMTGTLNMTGNVALHQSYLSGTTDLYASDFTLTYDDGTPANYEQFYAYAGSVDLVTRTGTYGWRMRNNDVGNNQWRLILNADGTFAWGDGAGSGTDTNLYRDAAHVLRTDDEFRAALIDGGTP